MQKKFAVIGNPIAHSKSPQIHAAFAQQFNIDLSYERILAPLDRLDETLKQFAQHGGLGVNITVPFKIAASRVVQETTLRAQNAGAVNTIIFNDGKWLGDNTDGIGLLRDLTQNYTIELTNKTILILGAGGATQGILQPLLENKPAHILIANRTLTTAQQLAKQFSDLGNCRACDLQSIPPQNFDLIINATSTGVMGQKLELPSYIVGKDTICYDLSYGQSAQPFLAWAKENHAKNYYDGLGMLVEQAAEAFYIWHGVMPETKSTIKLLK